MSVIIASLRVSLARSIAKDLLAGNEARWRHSIGVAGRAEEVSLTVPVDDRETLVVAVSDPFNSSVLDDLRVLTGVGR